MTVDIKIRLLGVFRGLSGKSQMSIRIQGDTMGDVVQALASSLTAEARRLLIDEELGDPRPNALILLNGKEISVLKGLKTRIKNGDEVTVIPVSHGG